MFRFLREKVKGALARISNKVEEEISEEVVEEKKVEEPKKEKPKVKKERVKEEKQPIKKEEVKEEKKVEEKEPEKKEGFFDRLKKGFVKEKIEEKAEEIKEETEEVKEEPKSGFFEKIREKVTTKKISEGKFDELFWDLEIALLENNVAVEVVEKIKEDLREDIVNKAIRKGMFFDVIKKDLKESIGDLFKTKNIDLIKEVKGKKPYVICFVGVNGSGKTTTIAKIVKLLQRNNLKCVLAASDTFRAASLEQLQEHADKLGVKLIKHDYGSDPAAVAFDAIKHAKVKGEDVVLIDTAGRMHSNVNLMDEMGKIIRVAKPDLKIFVGESITGNDCIEQAKKFDEAIGIDGIILAKADVDEKGGAAISVSYVTGKPILYLGVGQGYLDLEEFDANKVIESIGI